MSDSVVLPIVIDFSISLGLSSSSPTSPPLSLSLALLVSMLPELHLCLSLLGVSSIIFKRSHV